MDAFGAMKKPERKARAPRLPPSPTLAVSPYLRTGLRARTRAAAAAAEAGAVGPTKKSARLAAKPSSSSRVRARAPKKLCLTQTRGPHNLPAPPASPLTRRPRRARAPQFQRRKPGEARPSIAPKATTLSAPPQARKSMMPQTEELRKAAASFNDLDAENLTTEVKSSPKARPPLSPKPPNEGASPPRHHGPPVSLSTSSTQVSVRCNSSRAFCSCSPSTG